jgi:lipoate-protein ligase A
MDRVAQMRGDFRMSFALAAGRNGSWQFLVSDRDTAAGQMALDERLALRGLPTLRLFQWAAPAVSLGWRQQPPEWVASRSLSAHGVECIERPTGGGLAVHGSDLSCSVTIPSQPSVPLRQVMTMVCESVAQGLGAWGASVQWRDETEPSGRITYCLTEESPYALMAGRRKLGGFAIRRYPASWLIQGSMLVRRIPERIRRLMPPAVLETFQRRAIALEEAVGEPVSDAELIASLLEAWCAVWGVSSS